MTEPSFEAAWRCPAAAAPPPTPGAVSPDAPTNPVLYWIGRVDESGLEFHLEDAKGPFRLDLGDILYAPNVLQDDQVGGRAGRWVGGLVCGDCM
jgi:hypothetical protein